MSKTGHLKMTKNLKNHLKNHPEIRDSNFEKLRSNRAFYNGAWKFCVETVNGWEWRRRNQRDFEQGIKTTQIKPSRLARYFMVIAPIRQ